MDVLERARAGDAEAFRELVRPHERELRVHCYRMLGSLADAEDALQDTLLSAWQGLASFEGRASLRTWLYRVATSRCLDALRAGRRRPVTAPAGSGVDAAMADLVPPPPTRLGEVTWLEPYPDDLLSGLPDAAPGPEARYELTESVSLAFIIAVQLLPPRQRAVLILRDVLGFRASEVAGILGTTEESVTSALKRARATLAKREPGAAAAAPGGAGSRAVGSQAESRLVRELTAAFAAADVAAVVALLTDDAWFTMPPLPLEYQGRDLAGEFLAATALRPGWVPALVAAGTRANGGQPAFGFYARNEATGESYTVGLLVLTLADSAADDATGARISAMTRFDVGLLGRFGLPG
jgi:RNA polymerase sigma-70 factor (TIGR02960 family)